MYLKYGTYAHDPGECSFAISRETLYSECEVPYAYRERWDIAGRLQIADQGTPAANQAAMTVAINALKTAYAAGGQDLMFHDEADNPTSHAMLSAETLTGVKVIAPPAFPDGRGAEYSTFRNYSISLEASFPDSSAGLISWTESIGYRGTGGAEFVYLVPRAGTPQQQWPTQRTPITIHQRGAATGANGAYPLPSAPVLGLHAEHVSQREINYEVPADRSGQRRVTWSYTFEVLSSPRFRPTEKPINS